MTNEKYTGNAILQKTFKTDLLSERRINKGGVRKYFVQNAHEAIVSQEEYDIVQSELASCSEDKATRTSCKHVFPTKYSAETAEAYTVAKYGIQRINIALSSGSAITSSRTKQSVQPLTLTRQNWKKYTS